MGLHAGVLISMSRHIHGLCPQRNFYKSLFSHWLSHSPINFFFFVVIHRVALPSHWFQFHFLLYFLQFWLVEKLTCYRCYFEWENPLVACVYGQTKVIPGKRTNRKVVVINLFFPFYQRSTNLPTHWISISRSNCRWNEFHLTGRVELNDLLAWKHNKCNEIKWKLRENNEESEKVNIVDGVWIETSIGSKKK